MKRIQKPIIAVILILVMVMNCSVALAAGSSLTTQQKAEALKTLHLFQGTDKGFELDKTLTREQAVTLIVRLLGAEEEALEKKPAHPFTDVWEWANPYVGYAYCNGITKGTGNNIFGYGEHVTEAQFLTMILRVLQYEDDADFTWDSPYALAERLGLPVVRAESGTYTRGNAVDVIWALLGVQFKSGNQTLAEALIAKGVFTLESYKEVCGTSNSDSGRPSNSGWPVIQPKPDEPVDPEIPDDPEEPDGLVVYVAADGDDSGAGTKDAPFRTLEAARDYVRSNNTDKQPVTVFLRGGEYVLSQTFTLTAEDSGTAEAPVSYRAYPDEEVVISGSGAVSFQAFTPVTGEMKDKLPTEDAQNHVMVADIRDLGIDSISVGLTDSNFRIQAPLMMLDGHQLSLTRYPNSDSTEDWLKVNTVAPTQATGTYPTIQFEDETVWGWEHNTDDLIYFGFFSYGWALHGFHGEMDPQTKTVAATDSSHYGSSSGEKPVQIYNAYESMDEPGEWYYDRQTGKLYIYPFDDTTAASELWVTQGNFDLISVEDAAYISLEGLTVSTSKASGVVMDGVDHCVINNCKLTNFEGLAVSIDNAVNSGIQNSEVAVTSVTAIYLDGGDFRTMTPGNNFISNNLIHDTNQYRTFNEAGVKLRGVQNTFSHNEVYDIADMALNFAVAGDSETSLDCVIEYNSFHDIIINGKDMGAVYGGRDARCQGIIIRNNHFYNLGNNDSSYPSFAGAAVYMDDGLSGSTVTNNIFGPGASNNFIEGIKINCGHDHKITNNLFIDMPSMFLMYIDDMFESRMVSDDGYGTASSLREVWNNELYTARWPWMAAARDGSDDYYINNICQGNILIYTDTAPHSLSSTSGYEDKWYSTNGQDDKVDGLEDNLIILKDGEDNRQLFGDYENGDYTLSASVLAQQPGFRNIDQSTIGLQTFRYDGETVLPGGAKPEASNVSVSGTAQIGMELSAVYTFTDADGDSDIGTSANFFICADQTDSFYLNWKKVSDNTASTTFTVTPICEGKWIRCLVTPVDSTGVRGEPVWSDPVFVEYTSIIDRAPFRALVEEAKAMVEAGQIGDEPGQWSQKEMDLITAAIADAERILAQDPISKYDFDQGQAAFQKAFDRFRNNQNAGVVTNLVEIDALIEDAENWTPWEDNQAGKPVFAAGKLKLDATSAYQTACYTGKTYSNKIFSFKYQQNAEGDAWGGFYLNMGDPAKLPFTQKSILVTTRADGLELQIRDGVNTVIQNKDFDFVNGKTYQMNFGLYDVNSTDICIVLTVDGEELFRYTAENEYLHAAEGYFGVITAPNGIDITIGSVGTKLLVDSLIEDEENWSVYEGTVPKFVAGKMILEGTTHTQAGFSGEKFTNKVLHFNYRQDITVNDPEKWGGVYFNSQEANTIPWGNPGLLVCIKPNVVELQIRDGATTTVLENKTDLIESGKVYSMTFGMYDVNSTDVRIVLTADDMILFDKTVTNPKLLSMAGYYGAVSCGESVRVEIGSVGNKINVATLVRDQENWTTQTGTAPVFEDQSLSITSGSGAYELAAYTGEKFSGKVFSFKYKQTMPDSDPEKWGGFYFNLNGATTQTWGDKGVLVVIKPEAVELQRYGDQSGILKTVNGEVFRSDMVYDVTFGIYDVNSTDVRIIMTVDGNTLFDETITDSTLHGASGYFGAIACPGGIQVTLNDLSGNEDHYNKVTPLPLDGIIADTANWKDFSWAGFNTKPVFGDGTVSVTGTTEGYVLAGYAAEKYRNTEFKFKYQQTVDDAANNWGGFIYSFSDDVTNLAWNSGGVMVSFEKNKTTLYAYGDAAHSPLVTTDKYLENGTTHDISFSVCQTGAKELRVILTVDEEVWFNALYTDAKLANTAGYFCVAAVNKASATIQATGEGGVIDPPAENYTLRTVNDLLADPSGWTLADWGVLPTFGEGSITASGASNYSLGGTEATFKDTVFKFKYQQTRFADDSWAGFYLNFAPDNVYWNVGGVSIDFNQNSAVLHCFDKSKAAVLETSESLSLTNGQEYEITFGVYTLDEETVKVLLTVDGTTVFEKEIKCADLVNAELHFGIISRDASATISGVADEELPYTLRTVNDLLADPSGWTLADWGVLPTFGEGSITASGASNYSLGGTKATFKDTVFKFKYQQTRFADGSWAGFYLNFAPDNVYWNVGGVSIDFNQNSAVLHCYDKSKAAVLETSEPLSLTNGQEYEITFGVYTLDEETVKVLLTVDGTTVFEKEIKCVDLVNAELHFGIVSRDASATISGIPAA